ncbi:hypothetical protein EDD58_102158 [Hazenella coriacea]|uniref:Uncharacterized protein n=1 Tax=Hazenella coriacea TaxID=1179467 RepID=A0A4R3LBB0_9BACL|nr:hypothetical protein EDD58_102158 [Hazenella coriacea]
MAINQDLEKGLLHLLTLYEQNHLNGLESKQVD